MTKEEAFVLAQFPGFSNRQKNVIAETMPEAEVVVSEPAFLRFAWVTHEQRAAWKQYIANASQVREQFGRLSDKGISCVTVLEDTYPSMLRNIYHPPFILYYKGRLPEEGIPHVAVVGARDCSHYGREMAEYFAAGLAAQGVGIISGLAFGIDGAAHRGALQVNGYTLGILGCGVDFCYPKEHYGLYEHMIQTGGILSEFPVGTKPLAQNFPQRNRLISGLAHCVLVMEAREKSGSLITVEHALEQGKDVFAMPGRIGDRLSEGCNRLIQNGAQLLREPEEVLEYLQTFCKFSVKEWKKTKEILADEEKLVYSCLDLSPKHLQIILEETGLPFPVLAMVLLNLEEKGWITQVTDGYFAVKKRGDP